MIKQITKKELKRIKSMRKLKSHHFDGILIWIAPDNKAYKCDQSGMAGVKEMQEHNTRIVKLLTAQEKLL